MDKLPDNLHSIMAQFLDGDHAKTTAFVHAATATLDDVRQMGKTGLVYINDKDFGTERYLELSEEGEDYRRAFFPTKDEQIADLRQEFDELVQSSDALLDEKDAQIRILKAALEEIRDGWEEDAHWAMTSMLDTARKALKATEELLEADMPEDIEGTGHVGFYLATADGTPFHVLGDPNMSPETADALRKLADAAQKYVDNLPDNAPPDMPIALSDAEIAAAEAEDREFMRCHICGELAENCDCFDEFIDDDVDRLGPPDWMKDASEEK